MKIYLVGGAVRDELMGRAITERDWVVVGGTIESMLSQGYSSVGKHFPVFLHPVTKEEYALARIERKTSGGYHGFEFDTDQSVTLEEDLKRRDLTINAMAKSDESEIIDPYGGQQDLKNKILRHVSNAFVEDPVRVLRVARFAARFSVLGFTVAPETMMLMETIVDSGECDHLVPERIWKEISRALTEPTPTVFFEILAQCGVLNKIIPGHVNLPASLKALSTISQVQTDPRIRWAAFIQPMGEKSLISIANYLKIPNEYSELALNVIRYQPTLLNIFQLNSEEILQLLEHLDAFRRPSRLQDFISSCQIPNESAKDFIQKIFEQLEKLDVKLLVAGLNTKDGEHIKTAIRKARLETIMREVMPNLKPLP